MPWIILLISAVFEAVWATALGSSHGLSEPVPTMVFLIGLALSMIGLAIALRKLSLSVAYAVWIGVGAALTVTYAMLTGAESVSALKVLFLGGIVASVIGLKFVKSAPEAAIATATLTASLEAGDGEGARGPI
ncbi:DMT family transporter [Nocardia sp. GCM10030253]|uniref:DMT family transporter n=1 Tax=Nocardia sp. GCM10030253 TaxID=3273404 RepID=UPI00362BE7BA